MHVTAPFERLQRSLCVALRSFCIGPTFLQQPLVFLEYERVAKPSGSANVSVVTLVRMTFNLNSNLSIAILSYPRPAAADRTQTTK